MRRACSLIGSRCCVNVTQGSACGSPTSHQEKGNHHLKKRTCNMKHRGRKIQFSSTSDRRQYFWSSLEARLLLLVFVIFLVSAAVLLTVYFLCFRRSSVSPLSSSSMLSEAEKMWTPQCPSESLPAPARFDCYPEDRKVTRSRCVLRGCCWVGNYEIESRYKQYAVPGCIYPINYGYYLSGTPVTIYDGFDIPLTRIPSPSRYGDDIQEVHVLVEMQTPHRLRIKFYDPKSDRYEVPSPKIPMDPDKAVRERSEREADLYSVTYTTKNDVPFAVKVRRTDNDIILFDTSVGGLTISDHLLEVSTLLPSSKIYGLGEHVRGQLHHDMMWHTWDMFARPFLQESGNTPGVHPMYLCLENDGNAHGVLLLNSNAMEVVLQPLPAITFRSIGGIFDFYLFLGPTPEDVIKQYTEAVGRPMMPPYWALGLHIGRHGYHSTADAQLFLNSLHEKDIPMEALNLDAEVLQQFALNAEKFASLPNLTSYLHNKKQKLLLAVQPGMRINYPPTRDPAYNIGLQQKVFITDKWGLQPLIGKKGNEEIVYPDFYSSTTLSWWADVLRRLSLDVKFDGLWMIDNEPSNDVNGSVNGCANDDLNWPPYLPDADGKFLHRRTLCMDATQHWKDRLHKHYHLHNLYGHSMAMATANALDAFGEDKRKLLLSHSTFIGTGKYAGHWIEGIKWSWKDMKNSIPAVLQFSFFGIPFVGTNICGSEENKQESEENQELCLRWVQLGMFYPFSRMYNSAVGKLCKSGQFSKEFYRSTRHAIELRYELLPYLYNLFYEAHTNGCSVMRPLFHEFPKDNNTHMISQQFMWGSTLLIIPILEQAATYIKFYIPPDTWYDFYSYKKMSSTGMWMSISTSLLNSKEPVILYLRSGRIIPLQQASSTITMSRRNPLKLLVALNSTFEATGTLFWDDGNTKDSHLHGEFVLVDFFASQNTMTVYGHLGRKAFMSNFHSAFIQQVVIMGLEREPQRITIDDSYAMSKKQYKWDATHKVLHLKRILIPLARKTQVKWNF